MRKQRYQHLKALFIHFNRIKTPWNHAKTEISASKSIIHSFHAVLRFMSQTQNDKLCQGLKWHKINDSNIFYPFPSAFSLGSRALMLSEKFWLDRKIDFTIHSTPNASFNYLGEYMILSNLSRGMKFPTIRYVRQTKAQTSLRIGTVWSEPLLVAWIFYGC